MPARTVRILAKSMADNAFFPNSVVSWDEITRAEAAAYERALTEARNEDDMQRFLESHPRMLAQHLSGERLAWVMPQRRLGSEYVTDFLIAQRAAGRYSWCAVELERPQARMFTRNGDPSHVLTHALRQITDWRTWLARNLGYASRAPERSGLGLVDIEPDLDGMVIIGRDSEVPPGTADLRRTICRSYNVRIETYDWLLSTARDRLEVLERAENRHPGAELLAWLSRPRPEEPARIAVEEVFDGIFSTYSRVSALREVEWEGVVLDPDHPDVTAALRIVSRPVRPIDEILQPADGPTGLNLSGAIQIPTSACSSRKAGPRTACWTRFHPWERESGAHRGSRTGSPRTCWSTCPPPPVKRRGETALRLRGRCFSITFRPQPPWTMKVTRTSRCRP